MNRIDIPGMELIAYGFAVMVMLFLLLRYGKQVIKWILMKMHELFIQDHPGSR
jgi:hypothetical protein